MSKYTLPTYWNKLLNVIYLLFFVVACNQNEEYCGREGTIKDFMGQENCTLVIDDGEGDRFIPSNIHEFGLLFYDGQKIKYSFRLDQATSPCNLGVPVTIVCIEVVK